MDDVCVHCGKTVATLPLSGLLIHADGDRLYCADNRTVACLPQAGVE